MLRKIRRKEHEKCQFMTDGNSNGGRSRQTYTRQERFLLMVMSVKKRVSEDSDLLVFVC